jgi:hypothetical protein
MSRQRDEAIEHLADAVTACGRWRSRAELQGDTFEAAYAEQLRKRIAEVTIDAHQLAMNSEQRESTAA